MPNRPAEPQPIDVHRITLDDLAAEMWAERGEGAWPPPCLLQVRAYLDFAAMALAEIGAADRRAARS